MMQQKDIDKMRDAGIEAVLNNAEILFGGEDKTDKLHLAMAAGMIAHGCNDMLNEALSDVVQCSLKAARKADNAAQFTELLSKKIKKSEQLRKLENSMQFLCRFVDEVAQAAAADMLGKDGAEKIKTEVEARFGLN
jgi:translation initiation factor 2B subunit (eIF-2B alpha/beta/delta family)